MTNPTRPRKPNGQFARRLVLCEGQRKRINGESVIDITVPDVGIVRVCVDTGGQHTARILQPKPREDGEGVVRRKIDYGLIDPLKYRNSKASPVPFGQYLDEVIGKIRARLEAEGGQK